MTKWEGMGRILAYFLKEATRALKAASSNRGGEGEAPRPPLPNPSPGGTTLEQKPTRSKVREHMRGLEDSCRNTSKNITVIQ